MKQLKHEGPNTTMREKSSPGFVREKAPGPQAKQVNYRSAGPAPSSGQTSRGSQSGSTSGKTDGGGGMGNSAAALHKMVCGK